MSDTKWDERDERILRAWREDDQPTLSRLLAEVAYEGVWRPRDEWDQWTHPDSLRGHTLRIMDELDRLSELAGFSWRDGLPPRP